VFLGAQKEKEMDSAGKPFSPNLVLQHYQFPGELRAILSGHFPFKLRNRQPLVTEK
jgi:hypothetical protein